jgi:hypothetical protein
MTAADRRPEGPFAALDDYDARHVVTHLMNAGRDRDVHRLLRMEAGGERRNGWFAERERRGDVGGYLDDVAQAWTAASRAVADAIANGRAAAALPLELRYALITSSINSLSRNLPPALLAALVADGIWSITRSLRYAAQQPFAPLRAEAFALLAGQCPQDAALDCLRQARSAAREIRYRPDWRVRALGQVAAHAPPDLRRDVVGEALDVLREVGSVEADENVATLMAAAPDDMRDEVEALLATLPVSAAKPVRAGGDNLGGRPSPWTYGVRRFAELLPGLGEPVRLTIIGAFRNGEEEAVYRGIVIGACAGQEPALADEALDIAGSIPDAPLRAEVIAAVAPHLDEAVRARVLGELLAEARETDDPGTAARVLTAVAPALPEADRQAAVDDALSAIHTVEDGMLRSYLLRFLTPFIPAERLADVVAEAGRLSGNGDRGRVVAALAPRVPRSLLPDLIRLCQEIADLGGAIRAVVHLAEAAQEDVRREVLARALSTMAAAPGPGQVYSLVQLIPHLNTEQFRLASEMADRAEGADRRWVQVVLADHATDDVRVELVERGGDPVALVHALLARSRTAGPPQRTALLAAAWRVAGGVEDLGERVGLSIELLGVGECADAEERARELLAAVRESDWTATGRANTAASLVPFLPADERPGVVADALARIREELDEVGPTLDEVAARLRPMGYIPYEDGLKMALGHLFPHLTAMHYAMVLGIIRDIREENVRARALTAFAEHAPGAVAVPSEYFGVAGTFTRLRWWADVHCAALPLLPDGEQRQALIDVLLRELRRQPANMDITTGYTELWDGLISYLSGADLRTALEVAATVHDTWIRDYLLSRLVPHVDETEAITVVSMIGTPRGKVRAFIALAERGDSVRDQPEFLAAAGQLGADTELLPVAALLPDEQRLAVLDAAARELMDGRFTWSPRPPLANHLANASPARRCAWWQETAPTLAGKGRDAVFTRIEDLDEFMYRVAGERIGLDIAAAILDVVRWWP